MINQPKKTVKKEVKKVPSRTMTENEKAHVFLNEYQALCDKHGFQIQVTPAYKVSQDTGTWSTILQTSVSRLPQKK